jgi:hypothetical protein
MDRDVRRGTEEIAEIDILGKMGAFKKEKKRKGKETTNLVLVVTKLRNSSCICIGALGVYWRSSLHATGQSVVQSF